MQYAEADIIGTPSLTDCAIGCGRAGVLQWLTGEHQADFGVVINVTNTATVIVVRVRYQQPVNAAYSPRFQERHYRLPGHAPATAKRRTCIEQHGCAPGLHDDCEALPYIEDMGVDATIWRRIR